MCKEFHVIRANVCPKFIAVKLEVHFCVNERAEHSSSATYIPRLVHTLDKWQPLLHLATRLWMPFTISAGVSTAS